MFCIILVVILVFSCMRIYNTDVKDRTHPFGTDTGKNMKYTKGIVGEENGVGTFWGKPAKKDDILENLNKIQWLANSSEHDVLWRRSIVIAVFSSILIAFAIDVNILLNKPSKLLFLIFFIFLISYFSMTYYKFHVLWRRIRFINTHIRKIKTKLGLPLYNKIDEIV